MQALILTMIVAVTCFPFLVGKGWLPALFNYLPELLSGLVAIYVVVRGVESRFQYVRSRYWVIFGVCVIVIASGAFVNQLGAGPMFAGLRYYLRAIPFFLLPAVMLITERQLRTQLIVLLAVCLVQLPIAWSQRIETEVIAAQRGLPDTTGDNTVGTLITSGNLTLFLIAAACVLTAFYIRKRLSGWVYLALLLVVLLPTALNETKVTIFLLPIALLITFHVASEPGRRLRNLVISFAVIAGFLAIFIPIYDYFMVPRWGYGLIDFLMMEGRMERYLIKGTEIGEQGPAGRVDGLMAAVSLLLHDPAKVVFGLGIGNASDSALGHQFVGVYFRFLENFPLTSFSYILLELGLMGLALTLLLHWWIFLDSFDVARRDNGIMGTLAIGWAGVGVTIVIGLIYAEPVTTASFSYLYWYFSGLIAACRMKADYHRGVMSS